MIQDTPVTDRDFAALFRKEAGSILTEQQINDEIEREQTRSAQAARAGIAPNRFRGLNLQRYCKDIVRSHQPLSCLYLLLSDLTGAVSVLLPICCLLWVGTQTDHLSSGRGLLCLRYCLRLFLRHSVYLPPQTSHTA